MPIVWTLPTAFLSGTGAAAAIALINTIGNAGGFTGPHLVGRLKQSGFSFSSSIASLGAFILMSGIMTLIAVTSAKPRHPHVS